jgi:hypothetical protein
MSGHGGIALGKEKYLYVSNSMHISFGFLIRKYAYLVSLALQKSSSILLVVFWFLILDKAYIAANSVMRN